VTIDESTLENWVHSFLTELCDPRLWNNHIPSFIHSFTDAITRVADSSHVKKRCYDE